MFVITTVYNVYAGVTLNDHKLKKKKKKVNSSF